MRALTLRPSQAECDDFGQCSADCICNEPGVRCDCACATDGDYCEHGGGES